ncbi:hypothetical protein BU26DRAFT_579523 [Trematosphaeria pertusa]|uniref:Uncharacterized protein n=1 Tax=Trematosphaeria pertusa TaxID=390896 RepID=A0A6A6I3Q9_9PLEO|nr:uncharacterized protein BU26DRAFT_579523 [Trematosphaeria pertusa]KAF2244809.1 hypothetical protein BU26DRAFT_579523 [Trematosphaeria pertusa]
MPIEINQLEPQYSRLLSLPDELRNRIYAYVLTSPSQGVEYTRSTNDPGDLSDDFNQLRYQPRVSIDPVHPFAQPATNALAQNSSLRPFRSMGSLRATSPYPRRYADPVAPSSYLRRTPLDDSPLPCPKLALHLRRPSMPSHRTRRHHRGHHALRHTARRHAAPALAPIAELHELDVLAAGAACGCYGARAVDKNRGYGQVACAELAVRAARE